MMTSILDMQMSKPTLWQEFSELLMPLKYLITDKRFDALFQNVDFNYLVNAMFWIFLLFSFGFVAFCQVFQITLKASTIHFYSRKQFVRSVWNIAFYSASCFFLHFYNKFMILPHLSKNQGRYSLFYSSENLIFHKSQQCEKFQFYSLFIITYYMHGAMLDLKESDYLEASSKILYLLALIAIDVNQYEYYFVGLNLIIGLHNIITECLIVLALQNLKYNIVFNKIFLGMRIASWSYVFTNLLPFHYLVPTLYAKNFKWTLNISIWLWYGLSIWTSPALQYFYHKIYHNSPTDCTGEGSAVKCILVKDSSEYRHFKALRKAYHEVKLYQEKLTSTNLRNSGTENSSAKAFQAVKYVMTLKRKLKRIRQGHGLETYSDHEENDNDTGSTFISTSSSS